MLSISSALISVIKGTSFASLILLNLYHGYERWSTLGLIEMGLMLSLLIHAMRPNWSDHQSEMLRQVVEAVPAPAAAFDEAKRLLALNTRFAERHKDVLSDIDPENPATYPTCGDLDMPTEDTAVRDRRMARFGWLRVGEVELPGSGRVSIAIDVNDIQKREAELEAATRKARAADLSKTVFLSRMSHELRTPLNGIIGMANLIQTAPLEQRERDNARMIVQSGQHLLDVINNVLDHATLEQYGSEIEVVEFDIADLVASVLTKARAAADAKGIWITTSYRHGFSLKRRGDPEALLRVLGNLVDNAVKFTDQGGVAIEFFGDREGVGFDVRDTGIGIPPEMQSRIFEPFIQCDPSITRRHGGTGLGLTVCADVLRSLGGAITVDSTPGKGSTFTVRLPLAATDSAAA